MPKRKPTKHEDDVLRNIRQPDRYDPKADAQIVALKHDWLEKAAELRRLHQERVHDLNQIGGLQEENQSLAGQVRQFEEHRDTAAQIIKRLEAEVEALTTTPTSRLLRAERAENARLKAEVEELTHDANEADQQYEHAISRVRRLETEVERLTFDPSTYLCDDGELVSSEAFHRMKNKLNSEVERLRKAGDAMACHLVCSDLPNDVCGDLMNKWNAAKEGKQS